MTPAQKKSLFEQRVFLCIDFQTKVLRLSETGKVNGAETLFAAHPANYTEKEFGSILSAFRIQKVKLLDNSVIESRLLFREKPAKSLEILTSYENQTLKDYIFLLKRTMESQYFRQMKREFFLVPVRLTQRKMKFFKKDYSIRGFQGKMIVGFTDNKEFRAFASDTAEDMKEYKLFLTTIEKLKKSITEEEGIYLNPASHAIRGKDFAFAFTYDFMQKY